MNNILLPFIINTVGAILKLIKKTFKINKERENPRDWTD